VWWLQVLALAVLAWQLESHESTPDTGKRAWQLAALYGWVFATIWLLGSFGWVYVAMHTYGGLHAGLAGMAALALAGFLALYYAIACSLYVALRPSSPAWRPAFFALCWLSAELARASWLTGFGWGATAYAHVDGPLAAYAPWLGVNGMTVLAAWLAFCIGTLGRQLMSRRWRSVAVFGGVVLTLGLLPVFYQTLGSAMTASSGRLQMTLLQGNIAQGEKFEASTGVPQALQWYAEQLQVSGGSLVVAPETAIPLLPQQLPTGYWQALEERFASGQQAALIGIPWGNFQQGYTNSVVGLKPGLTQPWRYDKHHLVPFGEFIPSLFKWFTELMNIPLGDFSRGGLGQAPFEWQGQRISPNICVEDLYGEELAQNFISAAKTPTILVNVSNLAWFGGSLAMDQHLQIARLRALEFQRPFALATNTGLTAIVDFNGRVTHILERDTRGVLQADVEGRTGVTPYAWWLARQGLWPWWALVLGGLAWAIRTHLRKP
jgi:apolipoprotein N-acyltransferase